MSPGEPEKEQQKHCRQRYQWNKQETICRCWRRWRSERLLWGRWRTIYGRIETGDDEARTSTNCDTGDGASPRNVEHQYLTIGKRYEAELPIIRDSDRLRGTAQGDNPRWFRWHHRRSGCNWGENIQLMMQLVRHVDLASGGVVIHRAKLSPAEQGAYDPSCV